MENQLVVKIDQKLGSLNWNFNELNAIVEEQLRKYTGLVITKEEIKDAKEMVATLNNTKKLIERRRIDAGKEFCQPYEDFKAQVKVIVDKIDKASSEINVQIKDYEERDKAEKRERMEQWWLEMCKTSPQVDFEKVFEKKYLNKTCKDSDWQVSLESKYGMIKRDLEAIKVIDPTEKRNYVLSEYMKSLSLSDALTRYEKFSEQLKQAEQFRIEAEQRAKPTMERLETLPQAQKKVSEVEQNVNRPNTQQTAEMQTEVLERLMRVWGTRDQIIALAEFMNSHGIKFRKEG